MTVTEPERKALRPIAVVGLTAEIEQRWWQSVARGHLSDFFPPALLERLYAGEVLVLDISEQPPVPGQDYFGIQAMLVAPALMRTGHLCLLGAEVRGRTTFSPEEIDLARAAVRLVALILEREQLERERAEAQAHELAAVEAKTRMDEFVGIASHEMRTPLTSITANVQLAERDLKALAAADDGASDGAAHAKLERTHMIMERTKRQLTRLDRLVGDLIDISRIESGKLEPATRTRQSARHRARGGAGAAGGVAGADHHTGPAPSRQHTYLCRRRPHWTGYHQLPDQRPQVLGGDDSGDRACARAGDSARVEVRDAGPGLSTEQQARLFERFYRVPGIDQQSGSGVGLGLGLSICKTIVERHGGALGVQSAPGCG